MSARLPPFVPAWALVTRCWKWQRGVILPSGIFLESCCSALRYQVLDQRSEGGEKELQRVCVCVHGERKKGRGEEVAAGFVILPLMLVLIDM